MGNVEEPGVKKFTIRNHNARLHGAHLAPRQYGAMEFSDAPVDLDIVRNYRLGRIQGQLKQRGLAGILLYDQLNTRYAIDATNMQIWCSHNETRYVYVPESGGAYLFDYGGCDYLCEGLPGIKEARPAKTFFYYTAGPENHNRVKVWARDIVDLVHDTGGGNKRIALDRLSPLGVQELEKRGLEIHEGFDVMEQARKIKSPEEVILMQASIDTTEAAIAHMRTVLEPGVTENKLLSKLHEKNIELGGEWMETRLLSSGPRTNPWMRESSMRVIEKGDIVAFDTDMVGPYGYCADISRTWVCGVNKANDEQRRLYNIALEQIEYNKRIIKPGVSFRELSERGWPIPDEFLGGRYGVIFHGIGLCDEYPSIKHNEDYDHVGYDGMVEEGMCFCVESYIGAEGGHEGVKHEEQFVVTAGGIRQLSSYPIDEALM